MINQIKTRTVVNYPYGIVFLMTIIQSGILPLHEFFLFPLWLYIAICLKDRNLCKIRPVDIKKISLVYVVCMIQCVVIFAMHNQSASFYTRGMSTSIFRIIEIIFCYKFLKSYGFNACRYFTDSLSIAYSITIVKALFLFGVGPVVNSVFSIFTGGFAGGDIGESGTEEVLESAHATLLIMPLIALMYLIEWRNGMKRCDFVRFIIAAIISLLAYKRIAIGAALLMYGLFVINRLFGKNLISFVSVIVIALLILYIIIIHTGVIYIYAKLYDINLMFRDVLWPEFEPFYNISVSFEGQGWGFVTRYIDLYSMSMYRLQIGGLHNDILKIYIELGFIGFILYFGTFLIFIPRYLYKKYSPSISFYFWFVQLYLIIIYLTDNAMIYTPCQIFAYIAPFCMTTYNKERK